MNRQNRPNDRYLVICRKHWTTIFFPFLFGILLVAVGLTLIREAGADAEHLYLGYTGFILIIIALLVILKAVIDYDTCYLALTETQVIAHRGFIRSSRISAPVADIQNIVISNGFWGKLFRYHTISYDNPGTAVIYIKFICCTKAPEFERALRELQEFKRNHGKAAGKDWQAP